MKTKDCEKCHGLGTGWGMGRTFICPHCHGTGKEESEEL